MSFREKVYEWIRFWSFKMFRADIRAMARCGMPRYKAEARTYGRLVKSGWRPVRAAEHAKKMVEQEWPKGEE